MVDVVTPAKRAVCQECGRLFDTPADYRQPICPDCQPADTWDMRVVSAVIGLAFLGYLGLLVWVLRGGG